MRKLWRSLVLSTAFVTLGCIYLSKWMPQEPEFLHLCKCPPQEDWDGKLKSPRYTEFPKPVIESPYQLIENPEEFLHKHWVKLEEQRELRRKEEIERLMRPPSFDKYLV